MRNLPFVLAIASFILAIVVFIYGGGARSIYGGVFFVLIGIVLLTNARRKK